MCKSGKSYCRYVTGRGGCMWRVLTLHVRCVALNVFNAAFFFSKVSECAWGAKRRRCVRTWGTDVRVTVLRTGRPAGPRCRPRTATASGSDWTRAAVSTTHRAPRAKRDPTTSSSEIKTWIVRFVPPEVLFYWQEESYEWIRPKCRFFL